MKLTNKSKLRIEYPDGTFKQMTVEKALGLPGIDAGEFFYEIETNGRIEINGAKYIHDYFFSKWITENAVEEIRNYRHGELTLRGLHYRLVSRGMLNTMQHYKRVVTSMGKARWDGLVDFETFSDHDRETLGETAAEVTDIDTKVHEGKQSIEFWMDYYRRNPWENQPIYPEVWIEKKALIGAFQSICTQKNVALAPCKGYPSLTFLNEAKERFIDAVDDRGQQPMILYFGDYDPSGEDIPRSIKQTLSDMGVEVEVKRIALMEDQVIEWGLPPAPAKTTDSRTANWDGLGQVELDAVRPDILKNLCKDAIEDVFDVDANDELLAAEKEEREIYKGELKEFIKTL